SVGDMTPLSPHSKAIPTELLLKSSQVLNPCAIPWRPPYPNKGQQSPTLTSLAETRRSVPRGDLWDHTSAGLPASNSKISKKSQRFPKIFARLSLPCSAMVWPIQGTGRDLHLKDRMRTPWRERRADV